MTQVIPFILAAMLLIAGIVGLAFLFIRFAESIDTSDWPDSYDDPWQDDSYYW